VNWIKRALLRVAVRRFLEGEQMASLLAFFDGKKLYTTAIVSIAMALASLLHLSLPGVPEVDHSTAINMILTAIMGIFGRQAIGKVGVAKGPTSPE
jgi:hypothetical protein